MKRILICILALLLSVSMLCACSGDKTEGDKGSGNKGSNGKSVDLAKVLSDINTKFEFPEQKVVEDEKGLERYLQIKGEDVNQYAVQFAKESMTNSAVILIEAKNSDSVKTVETSLNNYLQSKIQNAKSYTPEAVSMLESCKVETNGNYVSLIIADNAAEIREAYNSNF